jgi:hypothetical protein
MIISIVSISSIDVGDGRKVDVKSLRHNFEIQHETLIESAGTVVDMYMWQMVMSSVCVSTNAVTSCGVLVCGKNKLNLGLNRSLKLSSVS